LISSLKSSFAFANTTTSFRSKCPEKLAIEILAWRKYL